MAVKLTPKHFIIMLAFKPAPDDFSKTWSGRRLNALVHYWKDCRVLFDDERDNMRETALFNEPEFKDLVSWEVISNRGGGNTYYIQDKAHWNI